MFESTYFIEKAFRAADDAAWEARQADIFASACEAMAHTLRLGAIMQNKIWTDYLRKDMDLAIQHEKERIKHG